MQKTIIEPNGHNFQYWKDIWRYRELAVNFAKRDITVRYKQTVMGLGWSVVSPIISMILMTFIFGNMANLKSEGDTPYFIMVFAGIIPWGLFSRSLQTTTVTFVSNADIMKKVYFPRILSPIGSNFANLVDTAISFGIFFILAIVYAVLGQFTLTFRMLLVPVVLFWTMILGTSLGLFFSAYNVKWRDLGQIIPFLVQIGQYASPVAYTLITIKNCDLATAHPFVYYLYCCNPAVGLLQTFKWCIFDSMSFDWLPFAISIAWTLIIIPIGISKFRKTERNFVDIV